MRSEYNVNQKRENDKDKVRSANIEINENVKSCCKIRGEKRGGKKEEIENKGKKNRDVQ
jgi:hypothetical protein